MARTYALIGTRPDIGGILARAQLETLWPLVGQNTAWGLGLFENDEVLLKRGPGGPESQLLHHVAKHRSHALLAHECDGQHGKPNTEHIPPLRYGHVLFSCHGIVDDAGLLMGPVRVLLPESLTRSVRGETFTEIAFALFLAELPPDSLARTRLQEPGRSADPLRAVTLQRALRSCLNHLDEICSKQGLSPFTGDLWVHAGEILLVAHRQGSLTLHVDRGLRDLDRWSVFGDSTPPGMERAQFVALSAGGEASTRWERLPDDILFTAERGRTPQTESL